MMHNKASINPRPEFTPKYRRWAGKASYVHLAPEHEYRAKRLMKAHKN